MAISLADLASRAGAQTGQTAPNTPEGKAQVQQSMNRRTQLTLPRDEDKRADKKVSRLEELPEVPAYTGKVEIADGHELSADGRVAFRFRFYAKEKPEEIAEWYEKALTGYNWKLVDKTETDLTARNKQGSLVTVNALRANHNGFTAVVKLYYTQGYHK